MDIGECDDTVDAVNAGKKRSGWVSAKPRMQVKCDPLRAPLPMLATKRPADDQGKKDNDDRRKANKKELVCCHCGEWRQQRRRRRRTRRKSESDCGGL